MMDISIDQFLQSFQTEIVDTLPDHSEEIFKEEYNGWTAYSIENGDNKRSFNVEVIHNISEALITDFLQAHSDFPEFFVSDIKETPLYEELNIRIAKDLLQKKEKSQYTYRSSERTRAFGEYLEKVMVVRLKQKMIYFQDDIYAKFGIIYEPEEKTTVHFLPQLFLKDESPPKKPNPDVYVQLKKGDSIPCLVLKSSETHKGVNFLRRIIENNITRWYGVDLESITKKECFDKLLFFLLANEMFENIRRVEEYNKFLVDGVFYQQ